MATAQLASMLDELMGRNRNDADAKELLWSDGDVCKYYLVDFCPHELFTNTKADLGPCAKIHDDELKSKFQAEKESSFKKAQHIEEFIRFCQRMLVDLQNRIKKAKERLLLTQNEDGIPYNLSGPQKEMADQISLLSQKITALVEEAEKEGCQGNVEQAQGLLKLSDQLKEERDQLKRALIPNYKEEYANHQKSMEVCDTCGAFLIVGDAQQRIDDHLMGKQHLGYSRLKASLDRITEERQKFREERDRELKERRLQRDKEVDERRRNRDSQSSGRSSGRRDRDRERDHRRNGGSRDRSRPRSSSKKRKSRSRSRDRNPKRRSRSGERGGRDHRNRSDRDRDRTRRRSKERRRRSSRSRSKDRKGRRRSRSRDRSSKSSSRTNDKE
ncbi:hypothetical protein TCAL_10386 [Tigriopus californicus]|uniref:Luc7-like protein 3 n=1 Tax=Tigriopus californicus TaxID=6832 RepID=A0A553P476_TIGCA|nr:luc7-like protein 3 [Tigriopus californicus]TRY72491.1 hypothetical protein TCAL_10386 [Tigriopus californicus]|eukprot:TCALIF_10386-PA protein Name:"Similar to LUC7L3 Luc7-like protein 3 (Pongo abelii)" AED:0.01 eAED:0.01 QI:0/-1/0/1/-1/1/1/0/385